MNNYCALFKFSKKYYANLKNQKETIDIVFSRTAKKMGGKVINSFVMIGGEYNFLAIIEVPSIANFVATMAQVYSEGIVDEYKAYTLLSASQFANAIKLVNNFK